MLGQHVQNVVLLVQVLSNYKYSKQTKMSFLLKFMVSGVCGVQHQQLVQHLVEGELLSVSELAQIQLQHKMEDTVKEILPKKTCLAMNFYAKVSYVFLANDLITLLFTETFLSFVVGGSNRQKPKPEIVELPKANFFPNLPYLPKRISGSNIIGLTDDHLIIICGITIDSMTECFYHFMNNRSSQSVLKQTNFTMLSKRAYAASEKLINGANGSWIITGGEQHDTNGGSIDKLDTTEIFSQSKFLPGPLMPQAVSMHCLCKLNMTHIVNTGGRGTSSRALDDVDVLSSDLIWGKLPDMNIGRYGHACGHYGNTEIIVAGGLNIKGIEIFLIKFSEW